MYSTNLEFIRPYLLRFQSYLEETVKIIPLESSNAVILDSSDNFYFYNYFTAVQEQNLQPSATNDRKKRLPTETKPLQSSAVLSENLQSVEYIGKGYFLFKPYNGDIFISEFGSGSNRNYKPKYINNTKSVTMCKKLTFNLIFYIIVGRGDKQSLFVCKWQSLKFQKLHWSYHEPPLNVEYVSDNKIALLTKTGVIIMYDLLEFSASKVIIPKEKISTMTVGSANNALIHCFTSSKEEYICYDQEGNKVRSAFLSVDENEGSLHVVILDSSHFLIWSENRLRFYDYADDRCTLIKDLTAKVIKEFVFSLDNRSVRFHKVKAADDGALLIILRCSHAKLSSLEDQNLGHEDIFLTIKWDRMLSEDLTKRNSASFVSSLKKNHLVVVENSKKRQIIATDMFKDEMLCAVTSDSEFLLYEAKFLTLIKHKKIPLSDIQSIRFASKELLLVQHGPSTHETTFDLITIPLLQLRTRVSSYLRERCWRFADFGVFLSNNTIIAGIVRTGVPRKKKQSISNSTLPSELMVEEKQKKEEDDKSDYSHSDAEDEHEHEADAKKSLVTDNKMDLEVKQKEQSSNVDKSKKTVEFIHDLPETHPVAVIQFTSRIRSTVYKVMNALDYAKVYKIHGENVIATKQRTQKNISKVIDLSAKRELNEICFNEEISEIVELNEYKAAASMGSDGKVTTIAIFDWKQGFLYMAIDCIHSPFLIGEVHNHFIWADSVEEQNSLMDLKMINLRNCKRSEECDSLEQELTCAFSEGQTLLSEVAIRKNAVCFSKGKRKMFFQDDAATPDFIVSLQAVPTSFEFFKTLFIINKKLGYSAQTLLDVYRSLFPKLMN